MVKRTETGMALVETPGAARWLGYAGLLPQAAAVCTLWLGGAEWRFQALAFAYAYAALILSFLGGIWWGLASRAVKPSAWMYAVAVVPSLFALATAWPWMTGGDWPQPSLIALSLAIFASPFIDVAFYRLRLTPAWWMSVRVPLSIILGILTLAAGMFTIPDAGAM